MRFRIETWKPDQLLDIIETILDLLAKPYGWTWRRHFATMALIAASLVVVIYLGWLTSRWWLPFLSAPQL